MKETCVYLVMNTMRDTTALETVHKATRDVTSTSIRGGGVFIYLCSVRQISAEMNLKNNLF